ncbi:hypothetical protein DFH28DRAFT_1195874 [Melampsora americana]|nr:hypothetical protein DFH28DRAFT_1195874 [Melampsora americana]
MDSQTTAERNSHTDGGVKLPRAVQICNLIKELKMTPKSFMQNMIDSDDDDIVHHRQYWGTETGWNSTEKLVLGFKGLILGSPGGFARWEQFILNEAKEIVKREDLPKGNAPAGAFYSSDSVGPEKRANLAALDESMEARSNEDNIDNDQSTVEALEGISHSVELEPDQLDGQRLEQIAVIVLAMISFACNRRFNGVQIQNSLAFVACGISQRMNDFLGFIGLTSSGNTALKVMDSLGSLAAKEIKSRASKSKEIQPSMILDNIDIQARDLDPADLSTENLIKYIQDSQKEPFNVKSMLPNQKESEHWALAQKSQLANALISYVVEKDSPVQKACRSHLKTLPPPIDQIEVYEPDLLMLKMMSASNGSAAGVSEMLDQCKKQMGEDSDTSTNAAQIIEGDMGTCMNFESLIRQFFPAGHKHESLNHILNLPGLAHTLWNVASKILSHHWGDSKDSADTGVHRTAGALGMETTKLPSQKDFNSLMQVIHKSHTATLVFLLK